jgi:hypothetical protein
MPYSSAIPDIVDSLVNGVQISAVSQERLRAKSNQAVVIYDEESMRKGSNITGLHVTALDPLVEMGQLWREAHERWDIATRTAAPLYSKRDATIKERRYMAAALRRADKAAGAMREVENFAIENPPSTLKGALVVAEMIYDLVDREEPEGALAESLITGLRNMND